MPEAAKTDVAVAAKRTNLHASRGRLALYHGLLLAAVFIFWYVMTEPGLVPPFYFVEVTVATVTPAVLSPAGSSL